MKSVENVYFKYGINISDKQISAMSEIQVRIRAEVCKFFLVLQLLSGRTVKLDTGFFSKIISCISFLKAQTKLSFLHLECFI